MKASQQIRTLTYKKKGGGTTIFNDIEISKFLI